MWKRIPRQVLILVAHQAKKVAALALTFSHTGKGPALPLFAEITPSHKVNERLIQFKMKCY